MITGQPVTRRGITLPAINTVTLQSSTLHCTLQDTIQIHYTIHYDTVQTQYMIQYIVQMYYICFIVYIYTECVTNLYTIQITFI